MKRRALLLAAGQGTRMKDHKAKVLTPLLGKSFLHYVIDACRAAGIDDIYPIVGYQKEEVQSQIQATGYFIQEPLLGTGHAVMQARALAKEEGLTIVMAGDQPLIQAETIKALIDQHLTNRNALTLLTVDNPTPYGYGRVMTNGRKVLAMVEEWDATDEQRLIQEVNLSVYCFDNTLLFQHIDELTNTNNKHEFYINDMVMVLNRHGHSVEAMKTTNFKETIGINDKVALAQATKDLQAMINERHMLAGVTMIDPVTTYIGPDVHIGAGTIIYPNTVIEGKVLIGTNCRIESSYIRDSVIGDDVSVGPFAHIRNESIIHNNVRIGNFVEVKKSVLQDGVKAAHLTYLGDSEIGKHVNIGCGTITVNYDGKIKHKTIIEANAFIGSNVNLIAPITIGEGSVIAAGSTVTDDVPAQSLSIARERQTTKVGYYANKVK
jgi:bifunctional UDP-N-acetylglucosamine pyrophosphorylase / glucosamine-1-phosphate N-acetyltransferase